MLSRRPEKKASLATRLQMISGPTTEPIALKLQGSTEKIQLNSGSFEKLNRISTARRSVENTIHRKLVQQTWDMFLDDEFHVNSASTIFAPLMDFGGTPYSTWPEIVLPFPPVQQILGVYTRDPYFNETLVPTSTYLVSTSMEPCRIRLAPGQVWPDHGGFEGFRIRFTCGYVSPFTVNPDSSIAITNCPFANGQVIQFTSPDGSLPYPLIWGQSYTAQSCSPTSFQVADLSGNPLTDGNGNPAPVSADWKLTGFVGADNIPDDLIRAVIMYSALEEGTQIASRIPGAGRLGPTSFSVDPSELIAQYIWPELPY